MSIINAPTLFELATRQAFRFESPKGLLSVEDLWNLPLTGATSLDTVSKLANRDVKASEEESFVTSTSAANTKATLKLDILKHIIAVRKEEIEARRTEKEKADRKKKLLDLLAKKEEESYASLSTEEIRKELESL